VAVACSTWNVRVQHRHDCRSHGAPMVPGGRFAGRMKCQRQEDGRRCELTWYGGPLMPTDLAHPSQTLSQTLGVSAIGAGRHTQTSCVPDVRTGCAQASYASSALSMNRTPGPYARPCRGYVDAACAGAQLTRDARDAHGPCSGAMRMARAHHRASTPSCPACLDKSGNGRAQQGALTIRQTDDRPDDPEAAPAHGGTELGVSAAQLCGSTAALALRRTARRSSLARESGSCCWRR
jgi:hypothetical protein